MSTATSDCFSIEEVGAAGDSDASSSTDFTATQAVGNRATDIATIAAHAALSIGVGVASNTGATAASAASDRVDALTATSYAVLNLPSAFATLLVVGASAARCRCIWFS